MSKLIAFVRRWLPVVILVAALVASVRAAEVIPAKPNRYFNDYALAVKPETADQLNQKLAQLERDTSDQILVAIYPAMQTDTSVDEYCLRIFRSWQVGQKDKNNGAVLFVFLKEHKLWIQTGRGISRYLTDATSNDITADLIAPRFKAGDLDGGLTAGVDAMIAACTKEGDFKGDGQTDYQKQHPAQDRTNAGRTTGGFSFGALIFMLILFFIISRFSGRGGGAGMLIGGALSTLAGGGGFRGGGGFGGGGGGGGDSGGFSSGGGDTDGGGAGSDW